MVAVEPELLSLMGHRRTAEMEPVIRDGEACGAGGLGSPREPGGLRVVLVCQGARKGCPATGARCLVFICSREHNIVSLFSPHEAC